MARESRFRHRQRDFDLSNPSSKTEYNRRLFSVVALRYFVVTRMLSFGRDTAWKRRLVRGLPGYQSPRILDLACGTGDLTRLLARRYPNGEVVGADLSEPMVRRARRHGETPNIVFEIADMMSLPFSDGEFDIVTGGYALRNAPSLPAVLRELYRVSRPGARFAFLEFSKSPRRGLQRVQLKLLHLWGSIWGWLLHRNPEVYAYIAESLSGFPDSEGLHELLCSLGFERIGSRRLMFGLLAITRFSRESYPGRHREYSASQSDGPPAG